MDFYCADSLATNEIRPRSVVITSIIALVSRYERRCRYPCVSIIICVIYLLPRFTRPCYAIRSRTTSWLQSQFRQSLHCPDSMSYSLSPLANSYTASCVYIWKVLRTSILWCGAPSLNRLVVRVMWPQFSEWVRFLCLLSNCWIDLSIEIFPVVCNSMCLISNCNERCCLNSLTSRVNTTRTLGWPDTGQLSWSILKWIPSSDNPLGPTRRTSRCFSPTTRWLTRSISIEDGLGKPLSPGPACFNNCNGQIILFCQQARLTQWRGKKHQPQWFCLALTEGLQRRLNFLFQQADHGVAPNFSINWGFSVLTWSEHRGYERLESNERTLSQHVHLMSKGNGRTVNRSLILPATIPITPWCHCARKCESSRISHQASQKRLLILPLAHFCFNFSTLNIELVEDSPRYRPHVQYLLSSSIQYLDSYHLVARRDWDEVQRKTQIRGYQCLRRFATDRWQWCQPDIARNNTLQSLMNQNSVVVI